MVDEYKFRNVELIQETYVGFLFVYGWNGCVLDYYISQTPYMQKRMSHPRLFYTSQNSHEQELGEKYLVFRLKISNHKTIENPKVGQIKYLYFFSKEGY